MKPILLAAALLIASSAALAQTHANVPVQKCEPQPEYPGAEKMRTEEGRKAFEAVMQKYKDCINTYINDRKAAMAANQAAATAAIDEHNRIMSKVRDDQEKTVKAAQAAQKEAELKAQQEDASPTPTKTKKK